VKEGTADERAARSPTAKELQEHVFPAFIKAAKNHPLMGPCLDAGGQLTLSLDNAAVHHAAVGDKGAAWVQAATQTYGLPGGLHINFVPPYSPDFHKPIEHSHGNTCRLLRKKVLELRMRQPDTLRTWDINQFWTLLRECFFAANAADAVHKDVVSQQTTFQKVVDLGGGYVHAKFT